MKKARTFLSMFLCLVLVLAQFTYFSYGSDNINNQDNKVNSGITISEIIENKELYSNNTVFLVKNGNDLKLLSTLVDSGKDFKDKIVYLSPESGEEIDVSSIPWEPIGSESERFDGTFDGQDYIIKGITVSNSERYQGLFGGVGGTVKNLTVEGDITANQYVGGITGYATSGATFQNLKNRINLTNSSTFTGGIVGYAEGTEGTISFIKCENMATISGTGNFAGGIVGKIDQIGSNFEDCVNSGTVTGQGTNVAGIAGYTHSMDMSPSVFNRCTNNGKVENIGTNKNYTAGILGQVNSGYATMSYCSNGESGSVEGNGGYTAGIIGKSGTFLNMNNCNNAGIVSQANGKTPTGGIIGQLDKTPIAVEGCYNSGHVIGSGTYTGGIVGNIVDGTNYGVKYCYNSGYVISNGDYVGGIAGIVDGFFAYSQGYSYSYVSYSYNTGTVIGSRANTYAGGISGANAIKKAGWPGIEGSGIYGYNIGCYNSGIIMAKEAVKIGAITGYKFGSNLNCCAIQDLDNYKILPEGANELSDIIANYTTYEAATSVADSVNATFNNKEDFASGRVAYILDGGETTSRSEIWGQGLTAPVIADSVNRPVYKVLIDVNKDNIPEEIHNTISYGEKDDVNELYIPKGYNLSVEVKSAEGYMLNTIAALDAEGNKITSKITQDNEKTFIDFKTPEEGKTVSLSASFIKIPENIGDESKITFDGNGGFFKIEGADNLNEISKTIKVGERIEKPATPVNGAYEFRGWFTDKECKEPFDFTSVVTNSMIIYAGWDTDSDYHDVTFDANGGVFADHLKSKVQTVKAGNIVILPEEPSKIGYLFRGWFQDKDMNKKYDISNKISEAVTLYAGWQSLGTGVEGEPGYIAPQYVVTFNSNGGYFDIDGSKVPSVEIMVNKGETITDVPSPKRDIESAIRYDFAEWQVSGTTWDNNQPISGNTVVTAKWEETDVFAEMMEQHGDSEEDPIEIPDIGTLIKLRDYVNARNNCDGKHIVLTGDITLPEDWEPIGKYSWRDADRRCYFAGNFNGQSHTIIIKSGQTEPLFGSFNGTSSDSKVNIKNLNLEVKNTNKLNCALAMYAGTKGRITMSNVTLKGKMENASAGLLYGVFQNFTMENCRIKSGSIISGGELVSGIVSLQRSGGSDGTDSPVTIVKNCVLEDNVSIISYGASGISDAATAKGVGGMIAYGCAYFEGCENHADFIVKSVEGGCAVGGMMGSGNSVSSLKAGFVKCINTGNITVTSTGANASGIGGLYGSPYRYNDTYAIKFEDCYNTGTIKVTGRDAKYIGGLAGQGWSFKDCYSYGDIIVPKTAKYIGPLSGGNEGEANAAVNSFYGFNNDNLVTNDTFIDNGATRQSSEDFESGKVAHLIKKNAINKWTQSEIKKYPELGEPNYYKITSRVKDDDTYGQIGTVKLYAIAKGVSKSSTSQGELYVPYNTKVKVVATPKETEIKTDDKGNKFKYIYRIEKIIVSGDKTIELKNGESFEFTTDETDVEVIFKCKKEAVIDVIPSPGDGTGTGEGNGTGDGNGTGTGNGDGTGNQDGAGNGTGNNGNSGDLTKPNTGNGNGSGQGTGNVEEGGHGDQTISVNTESETKPVVREKEAKMNNAEINKEQKESLNIEDDGSSQSLEDDEEKTTVFQIIKKVVKENPVATGVVGIAVIGAIGFGAFRRFRKVQ